MTEHGNEALIEQVIAEVFNTGNMAVIDQVGAHDLCVHYPQADAPLCGLDEIKRAFSRARAAFPDAYFVIEDRITAGDRVVIRWTGRATHTGAFWGIQPTGCLVMWVGITLYQFIAGRVAEIWIYADAMSLRQQLDDTHTSLRSDWPCDR